MFLKSAKAFLYTSLFSVIIVVPGSFFPFIGGKYFFFRTMVSLAFGSFLLSWAFEDQHGTLHKQIKDLTRQPLFVAVSAFVLMMVLAAVFAYYPQGAFWSNYERGEGAFQMLHYYLFFSLAMLLWRTWKEWKVVLWMSVAAGLLMISYGALGYLHIYNCNPLKYAENKAPASCPTSPVAGFITAYQTTPPESIPQSFLGVLSGTRFQGSLGNPAYVAPYLLFLMGFTLILWILRNGQNHKEDKKKNSLASKVLWIGLLLIFLLFFILAQTRGAFLGLLIGTALAMIYSAIISRQTRHWVISLLAIGVILIGALFVFRANPLIAQLPVSRLFEINIFEFTAQTRFWTWGTAWQGIKERPLLGWGQENFSTVFDKYFDVRHFNPNQASETWFDRAHSVFFDYGATTGLLGLLSYLTMLGFFIWPYLMRLFAKGRVHLSSESALISAVMVGLGISYFVQGFVLFDVLPIYIGLFTTLAFSNFFLLDEESKKNHHESRV